MSEPRAWYRPIPKGRTKAHVTTLVHAAHRVLGYDAERDELRIVERVPTPDGLMNERERRVPLVWVTSMNAEAHSLTEGALTDRVPLRARRVPPLRGAPREWAAIDDD